MSVLFRLHTQRLTPCLFLRWSTVPCARRFIVHRAYGKMPRNSSSSKRKSSPAPDGEDRQTRPKKSKTNVEDVSEDLGEVAANGQPTNKVLPVYIKFPQKYAGTIRIASWNVSGLAASRKKGFKYYVDAEDADILILTEMKLNEEQKISELDDRYPYRYWSIASKKGYAGTTIFSKYEAISISKDIPGHPDSSAVTGRIVTIEFEKFYLLGTYVTNAGQNLKTLPEKETWNEHFEKYIRDLDAKKPVIWAGDFNVAPTEKDLTHAKRNWNKTAGYTESEVNGFARILDPSKANESSESSKLIDVWRHLHPDDQHYTYFSYRFNCRAKGIGWRIDMFVLSERLLNNVKRCEIRSEIYGASDHCPVMLEISDVI